VPALDREAIWKQIRKAVGTKVQDAALKERLSSEQAPTDPASLEVEAILASKVCADISPWRDANEVSAALVLLMDHWWVTGGPAHAVKTLATSMQHLPNIFVYGNTSTHGLAAHEGIPWALGVLAAADLDSVADPGAGAADRAQLDHLIDRALGGNAEARLFEVARAGALATHRAGGTQDIHRAVCVHAIARLFDVARASGRPAHEAPGAAQADPAGRAARHRIGAHHVGIAGGHSTRGGVASWVQTPWSQLSNVQLTPSSHVTPTQLRRRRAAMIRSRSSCTT